MFFGGSQRFLFCTTYTIVTFFNNHIVFQYVNCEFDHFKGG